MRAGWIEVDRFKALSGSNARHARDWWTLEKLGTAREPFWMDEMLGTFTVLGRTFRILIGGVNSDLWVISELKARTTTHG